MRTAGIVLDIYDDPKGLVLRRKVAASGSRIPEKLASSRLLDSEELDRLPDRLFALVAENHGEVLRKYAMHDPEHLTTSIIYFLECGHLLPEDVQVKVASNLVTCCGWYDVTPPQALTKIAFMGAMNAMQVGLGAMDAAGKAREGSTRARQNMDGLRAAQASGAKVAGREVRLSPAEDAAMQCGEGPESGHIFEMLSGFSEPGRTHRNIDRSLEKKDQIVPSYGAKTSNLNGTDVMPNSAVLSGHNPRPSPNNKVSLAPKVSSAGWQHSGDISDMEPPTRTKQASRVTHFALPQSSRYPIDTLDQIKTAEAYLNEHVTELGLADRRAFSQSLVKRAGHFGLKVAGVALDYAGDSYGPFIESELIARVNAFEGTGREEAYGVLLEKRSEISPIVMVEMLKAADSDTGADRCYGRTSVGFRDPYRAVYGSHKIAEARSQEEKDVAYSWSAGSDYVSGLQLKELAKNGFTRLDETFGKGFATSFQNDPVGIFQSMPDPQKVVLSRLAASVV